MAKPSGARCNLDCAYCFYLSKEALYPGSRFQMDAATLQAYLRQVIDAHAPGPALLTWQGGEPTLSGLDFFRQAVAMAEQLRHPGQLVQHAIQTNGLLLDDEWCAFFKEHGFLVGLSLDGLPALHDAYRVDRGGVGTQARAVRAARLLQKHAVAFNLLCCVHAANQDHPLPVYRYLRDEIGAAFIQFIPVVERAAASSGPPVSPRSVSAASWGSFLCAVFDEWVRRDIGRVFVQQFDAALGAWLGAPAGLCIFSETCGRALALEHNGDVYACDHFVEPGYRLGNLRQSPLVELVDSPAQRRFGQAKRDTLPACCRACEVLFACHGECPRNRFIAAPDGEPGLNYLCAGYRAFFNHVDRPLRLMAELARRGRAPAEAMHLLALERMQAAAAQPPAQLAPTRPSAQNRRKSPRSARQGR
ncbi:MAG: anaerobic sulfatase maturase [Chloroflexota bacterium]